MSAAVQSLTEAANDVETQRLDTRSVAETRKKECSASKADLERSLKTSTRTIAQTGETMEVVDADIKGLEANVAEMKVQITTAVAEIDNVTQRLRGLRDQRTTVQEQSESTLQQIQAVVSRASVRERQVRRPQKQGRRIPPPSKQQDSQASQLQELGELRSQALSLPPPGMEDQPSLVQARSQGQESQDQGRRLAVRSVSSLLSLDKKEFLRARSEASRGFDEEEARLLELLKLLHKKVRKLEADLAAQQPSLADKVRQFAELNMTWAVANRTLTRDSGIKSALVARCLHMENTSVTLDRLLLQLSSLLRMPAKLLQTLDFSSLLATGEGRAVRSAQSESAPDFLQLGADSQSAAPGDRVPSTPLTPWQHSGTSSQSVSVSSLFSSPLRQGAEKRAEVLLATREGQGQSQGQSQDPGALDGVTQMIRTLISSLRAEGNQDVSRSQWCAEGQAQQTQERVAAMDRLDSLAAELRWAQAALARLAVEISFMRGEVTRLEEAQQAAARGLQQETDRQQALLTGLQRDREVAVRVLEVATEVCNLPTEGTNALLQVQRLSSSSLGRRAEIHLQAATSASSASYTGANSASAAASAGTSSSSAPPGGVTCTNAAALLRQALDKFDELTSTIGGSLTSFKAMSAEFTSQVQAALQQQQSNLMVAEAASAKRANELATSQEEQKKQQVNLRLVEEAQQELAQSCGPGAETAESRLQRRQEEVEALRGALAVLEGQAVPGF